MRQQVILLLIICSSLFASLISAECTGIYPPYETLPTASFNYKQMQTCCWYSRDTCCGVGNNIYNLQSIMDQIDNLATRGLDPECYYALVDLVCIWCDPTTSEWLEPPTFVEFEPTSVAKICPSFCDELFFKCFSDLDQLVNDKTLIHSSADFCEYMVFDNFYNNRTDLFPDLRLQVTANDKFCYDGVNVAQVKNAQGICIPEPGGKGGDKQLIVYADDAHSLLKSSFYVNFILLFFLLFVFFI